jgi:2-isopropylmalate synthase
MYQHIDPDEVGNRQRLVVSELAGRSNIVLKAKEFGLEVDRRPRPAVLAEVKRREALGWTYEAADASFELLLRRVAGPAARARRAVPVPALPGQRRRWRRPRRPPVTDRPRPSWPSRWVAARLGAGEGNGPVDALDHAFRNAVNGTWPQLDRIHLSDYKVRILEATAGHRRDHPGAGQLHRRHHVWDTVGVHPNVVEASWLALSDAYTHAILRVNWDG